jgi:sugar lactone lactonase YvrE
MPHKNKIALRWLIVAILVTQLACQTVMEFLPSSGTPPPDEGREATAEVPEAPAAQATAPALTVTPPGPTRTPAPPGLACAGHYGNGVTCIHEAEWLTFTAEEGMLSSDHIGAITTCPDERIVIAHPQGIDIFNGQSWQAIANNWGHSSVEDVACSANGEIWVAHFGGVTRWAAGEWTTYDFHEFLTTNPDASELVEDVKIDAQGAVWIVTASSLARYSEGEWTLYEEGQGFDRRYYFEGIAFDLAGQPWVAHSNGLLTVDGIFWENHAFPRTLSPTGIAVDHQGRVWVGTLSDGLHVFDGQTWQAYLQQHSDLSSNHVQALTVDGQNRVWVGTDWGINIFDGERWQSYWMSNAGLISNQIDALDIVRGGPRLPQPVVKAPGVISGALTSATGEMLPQMPIELCVGYIYRKHAEEPLCAGKPFVRTAETDAAGAFTFEDIPPGRYMLTANPGDRWYLLLDERGYNTRWITVQSEATTGLGAVALPPPVAEK